MDLKVKFICVLVGLIAISKAVVIGRCNTNNAPPSWLKTAGHGLNNWATIGVPVNKGGSFCLDGNKTEEIVEIVYHINISDTFKTVETHKIEFDGNLTNACLNQDPRIHYCVPFCENDDLQLAMIDAALMANGDPNTAVILTHSKFSSPENWAFSVINVNLNANPEAHLVVQSFLDPAWCSVYVGMKTFGDPYLFEMQAGIVLR